VGDIYQDIWDADQTGSGVRPIFDNQPLSDAERAAGFVAVNSRLTDRQTSRDLRVLPAAEIPASKLHTYTLCKALFENYALDEQSHEVETPEERQEAHDFVQAIVDTAPMLVAREYVERRTGTTISRDRWYTTVFELWFRRFAQGGDPDLSGFEHVLVGEQEGPKVQGYHFWYKYLLDDGFAAQVDGGRDRFPNLADDRIRYLKSEEAAGQMSFPESVTISFSWDAPDYDRRAIRPLTKQVGGFFVGCSPEGLMALGTVRAHVAANAPKVAVINGARYELAMFRSDDNKNLRTFYPKFQGTAPVAPQPDPVTPRPTEPIVSGRVKIVAAMVNPVGDDPDRENVTLINMGGTAISLDGWRLVDKNDRRFAIQGVTLAGGSAATLTLRKETAQLSNQGGEIRLINANNEVIHRVSYSKQQAAREGETLIF
jgi:poly(U)-specific endoribonuclease